MGGPNPSPGGPAPGGARTAEALVPNISIALPPSLPAPPTQAASTPPRSPLSAADIRNCIIQEHGGEPVVNITTVPDDVVGRYVTGDIGEKYHRAGCYALHVNGDVDRPLREGLWRFASLRDARRADFEACLGCKAGEASDIKLPVHKGTPRVKEPYSRDYKGRYVTRGGSCHHAATCDALRVDFNPHEPFREGIRRFRNAKEAEEARFLSHGCSC
eukprot:tig00021350_g20644.t1